MGPHDVGESPRHLKPQAYGRLAIFFHWLTAVVIFGLWGEGQIIDDLPKDWKFDLQETHKAVGTVLLVIFAARIVWRLVAGAPEPISSNPLLRRAAGAGHLLLYVIPVAVIATGLARTFVRGKGIAYLGIASPLAGNPAWAPLAAEIHALAADGLIVIAVGHAIVALWHHYIEGDDTLRRMLPGRRREGERVRPGKLSTERREGAP